MTDFVYVHSLDEVMSLNKAINLTMETYEVEREVAVEMVKEALLEGNRGIHPCMKLQGRVFIAVPLDACKIKEVKTSRLQRAWDAFKG